MALRKTYPTRLHILFNLNDDTPVSHWFMKEAALLALVAMVTGPFIGNLVRTVAIIEVLDAIVMKSIRESKQRINALKKRHSGTKASPNPVRTANAPLLVGDDGKRCDSMLAIIRDAIMAPIKAGLTGAIFAFLIYNILPELLGSSVIKGLNAAQNVTKTDFFSHTSDDAKSALAHAGLTLLSRFTSRAVLGK